ncbi:MAG: hypothetical protein XD85_0067 [Parcubacteria bacterium 34_609]|nr:MAG: hypothetical protein XD85_0067 [Parcubacteria bacterium 34_609]KUK99439.1 MAG: hypothetical protein XE08_0032 [Parcubacteria bacterium 32_520]
MAKVIKELPFEIRNIQTDNWSRSKRILRSKLKEWKDIWNNVRPYASLNYLTPNEYIRKIENTNIPTKDYINLQT